METPENEHQALIRKLVEESDQQYEAEIERQKTLASDGEGILPITKLPLATTDLENQ